METSYLKTLELDKTTPRAHWSVVHVHRQKEDRERRNTS